MPSQENEAAQSSRVQFGELAYRLGRLAHNVGLRAGAGMATLKNDRRECLALRTRLCPT